MKKEIVSYHYEVVVDKAYNERKKVTKPKVSVAILLSVLPLLVGFWRVANGGHFGLLFAVMYVTFIANLFLVQSVQEFILNKRVFFSAILTSSIIYIIALAFWLYFLGVFGDEGSGGAVLSLVVIFILSVAAVVGYGLIRLLIMKKKEHDVCSVRLEAVCVGNLEQVVNRYVDNTVDGRRSRRLSVAYGDDEKITIYTPIFGYEFGGQYWEKSPTFASSKKYERGRWYVIYVNPNNPTEIRVE